MDRKRKTKPKEEKKNVIFYSTKSDKQRLGRLTFAIVDKVFDKRFMENLLSSTGEKS